MLNIALLGNPNTGKTTIFNLLTGMRQRTGNWPGVTVERKEGRFIVGEGDFSLTDLPGIYAIEAENDALSIDEQVTCEYLLAGKADLIINVLDASSLQRNLSLTLQLRRIGVPLIVVLNMCDIAREKGECPDAALLSARLGCDVIEFNAAAAEGLRALKSSIVQLAGSVSADQSLSFRKGTGCQDIYDFGAVHQAASSLHSDICIKSNEMRPEPSSRLDKIVLNRWLGLPVFLFVMYLMFFFSINVGGALQPLFTLTLSPLLIQGMVWANATLVSPGWLRMLTVEGIGGGVTAVLTLIPQIAVMFFFLSLLEETGYMARAAFVVDRFMRLLGLPGKSFVPLIVGFGCNVPAVMGTRTLETHRDRLLTMMMAPFMPCGARLAIFAVFSGAFFGHYGALLVFSLYLTGIIAALATALLLRSTVLKGEGLPFIMEIPTWHRPVLRNLILQTWFRLRAFMLKAGQVIIAASFLISALSALNIHGGLAGNISQSALASISRKVTPLLAPMGVRADNWPAAVGLVTGAMAKESVIGTLNVLYAREQNTEDAKLTDPASNWGQQAFRETWQNLQSVFSLKSLLNPVGAGRDDSSVGGKTMGEMHVMFGSVLGAYSYLIFVLLYVPCASVMGALAKEAGRFWMFFSLCWGTLLAFSASTLIFQSGTLPTHPLYSVEWISAIIILNLLIIAVLRKSSFRFCVENVSAMSKNSSCNNCKGCG